MDYSTKLDQKNKYTVISAERIAHGLGGKGTGNQFRAPCPAHRGTDHNLAITQAADGKVLLKCHSHNCPNEQIIEELKSRGLWHQANGDIKPRNEVPKKKIGEEEFIYLANPHQIPAQKVLRIDYSDGSKTFPCSHLENGQWVKGKYEGELYPFKFDLWRNEKGRIFLVEGERKALSLIERGFKATCIPGGSGAWREHWAKHFNGRDVVILNDNDDSGRKFSVAALRDIVKVAASAVIIELEGLEAKEDVWDWWQKPGNTPERLRKFVLSKPPNSEELKKLIATPDLKIIGPYTISPTGDIGSPLPLRREYSTAETFPMDALGSVLGPAAKRLHEVIKAPDGIVAQSILGGAALAVQSRCDVALDGRVNPTSLYLISIADSGERKSAADHEALRPHREYEKELKEKYDSEIAEYIVDKLAFDSSRCEALKKAKSRLEKKKAIEDLGSPPLEPLNPMLLCEEPSAEGLWKLLYNGQPSIGVFSDEGGRLFGGYGMAEENQLKTCTALSEFWDAKRTTRVRGGDGASLMFGRRVSMHMMIQGVVALPILSNEIFNQQGFLARTLISWPAPMAGHRPYDSANLSNDSDLKRYRDQIYKILSMPPLLTLGKRNELTPRQISLNPEAKSLWVQFYDKIESQLKDGEALHPVKAFASKAPQHALRLAAVLAVVENPEATDIGVDEISSGIDLAQYYMSEALRLRDSANINQELLLAEKLLAWVKEFDCIYLSKIYQMGPSAIRDKRTAHQAVKVLEDHRWLKRIEGGREIDGAFRKEAWEVMS